MLGILQDYVKDANIICDQLKNKTGEMRETRQKYYDSLLEVISTVRLRT